tara:strand:+ start:51 stop:368 length:318 start_codon:yes stop_codon:yes gene_type:complete
MNKPNFKQWKNHYYDVPFIKENYDLLESMEVPIECIIYSQDTSDGKTKYVRVFTFGSWYEILENGDHYILVSDFEYMGTNEDDIDDALKELYDYVISKNVTKNLF